MRLRSGLLIVAAALIAAAPACAAEGAAPDLPGKGVNVEQMGRLPVASGYRLPDGQHFNAEGHAIFARSVLSDVAAAACGG